MTREKETKLRIYIHKMTVRRNTGEIISGTYTEDNETPEISDSKYTDMLLYALVGNLDAYIVKMLKDLADQKAEAC